MLDKLKEMLSGSGLSNLMSNNNESLYKFCKDLWDKLENNTDHVKRCWEYWNGELTNKLSANDYFPDQKRTNGNIVKPIVEVKLKNMLDAQFTIAVVPDIGCYYSREKIKDARAIADIYNEGLKAIYKDNIIESIDEKVGRDGEVCGYGVSCVQWSTDKRSDGEVVIEHYNASDVRWNKGAESNCLSVIAVRKEKPPYYVKSKYARLPDGSYDEERCKLIDSVTINRETRQEHKQTGSVINYINADTSTAGRAYAEANPNGIQGHTVVEYVEMYMLDDSVYAPSEKDSTELEAEKKEFIRVFPNGRKITFALCGTKKVILEDIPLDDTFKNLGNINIFNPTQVKGLAGKGEVDDIAPIQDRINGLWKKYREKVSGDFDTLLVDNDFGCEDSAIVRGGITRVDGYNQNAKNISEPMSNNGIAKAVQLLEAIQMLEQEAYRIARVNETMLQGTRQTGVNSAEQVEALQESPMVDIRSQQRNFKNYKIAEAEKCLLYMSKNYTNGRLIELSTGIGGANMASINPNSVELLKEVDGVIQTIKTINKPEDLKLRVTCVAGTEIPRSRKETADLTEKISQSPIMQSGDIDLIDMYLEAQDFPQRHALVKLLKQKQEEKAKKPFTIMDVLQSEVLGKNAAEILNALAKGGFSQAIGEMLKSIGLPGNTDTLETAPVQAVASKADILDVTATTKGKVSTDPQRDQTGREMSGAIIDKKGE